MALGQVNAAGETIVAVATAPGRSARALVRLSGEGTREVLALLLAERPRPFERGCFQSRLKLGSDLTLPVLVATFRGPRSYTGEDSAELLMPGNPALAERVLGAFTCIEGVRPAGPGEFTARAFLNDRITLEQAEGVAAVIAAETGEQLESARDLLNGRTGERYRAWVEELTTLLALVEAGIDFTDQEDVVPIAPEALSRRLAAVLDEMERASGAQAGEERGAAWPRVVLAGRPNAGKSTLFNALLGRDRAVVSPLAGTTRDALEEELDLRQDVPGAGVVMLVDMAGLDEMGGTDGALHADVEAQARAREAVARADVIVLCDPAGRFELEGGMAGGGPVIRVRTKADVPGAHPEGDVAVCALDGWNLPALRRAIADQAHGSRAAGIGAILPRHRLAMSAAMHALGEARLLCAADEGFIGEPELVAAALRRGLDSVGELAGRVSPDDIIGRIFAAFCVGK